MKMITKLAIIAASALTLTSYANTIGVVDVQKILESSSQAKSLRDNLQKQFGAKHDAIMSQGKAMQADIQNFQKNQAVLSPKDLDALKKKIMNEQQQIGQEQNQFQQDYMVARSKAMDTIMQSVQASAAKVAAKKNLDLVVAKQTVIYAKDGSDITSDVLEGMK